MLHIAHMYGVEPFHLLDTSNQSPVKAILKYAWKIYPTVLFFYVFNVIILKYSKSTPFFTVNTYKHQI